MELETEKRKKKRKAKKGDSRAKATVLTRWNRLPGAVLIPVNPLVVAPFRPGRGPVGIPPAIHGPAPVPPPRPPAPPAPPAPPPSPAPAAESTVSQESTVDYPASAGLCPQIWIQDGDSWQLRPEIRLRALEVVDLLSDRYHVHPTGVRLVGSICSNQYSDDADLDVHIQVDMSEKAAEALNQVFRTERAAVLEGMDLDFGGHPLEFYFQWNGNQDLGSCGCLDLLSGEWLSGPQFVDLTYDPFDVWEKSFEEACEFGQRVSSALFRLRSGLYRLSVALEWAGNTEVHSDQSLMDLAVRRVEEADDLVEEGMREVAGLLDEMYQVRRRSGIRPESPEEAEDMRTDREWLSDNSAYKYLQRLGLVRVCRQVADLLDQVDSGEIDLKFAEAQLQTLLQA